MTFVGRVSLLIIPFNICLLISLSSDLQDLRPFPQVSNSSSLIVLFLPGSQIINLWYLRPLVLWSSNPLVLSVPESHNCTSRPFLVFYQRVLNDLWRTIFFGRMLWLLPHPLPPPSPVSKPECMATHRKTEKERQLAEGRGGWRWGGGGWSMDEGSKG